MAKVLIVDDDHEMCRMLSDLVHQMGCNAVCEFTLGTGLNAVCSDAYDLVFLDVHLPDGNGLDIIPQIRCTHSSPEVIIITGFGDEDGAETAIKNGAWDYILKTDSPKKILLPLKRVIQYREGLKKGRKLPIALDLDGIIGTSPQMKACFDLLAQATGTDVNVLLTGETGTGKELFAKAIHKNSKRSARNLAIVDCAALPETLVESALFGHVKGAFTGADSDNEGLVMHADGGTLFLDEVGELPLSIQKKFLRILQEKKFRPVGSSREIQSDFRLISATNKNLDEMVKEAKFRNDLLFRLRTFHIELPALRNRPEDIKELTRHFIYRICEKHRIKIKGFVPEFMDLMSAYHWPGNVRELINTLEKAIVSDPENPTLYPMHLPAEIRIRHAQAAVVRKRELDNVQHPKEDKSDSGFYFSELLESSPRMQEFREKIISESEIQYLKHLMDVTLNNIQKASRISGLSPSRLYTLLRKYRISVKRK